MGTGMDVTGNDELILDLLLKFRNMGNDADELGAAGHLLEDVDRIVAGMVVKGAEAFIDEHHVQMNTAGGGLNLIRHTQGKRKSGHECLAAGQCFDASGFGGGIGIHHEVEPLVRTPFAGVLVVDHAQFKFVGAHLAEALVCRIENRLQILALHKGFDIHMGTRLIAGQAAVIVRGCGRYMGDVTLPFTIQKADTVIKFKAPGTKVYNTYGYTTSLGAKIEKGNEKGKLSYQSSDQSVATVSDAGTIHDEGVGATTITITCPESDNYKAATVSTVYTIKPGKQAAFVKRSGKKMRVSWYKVSSASGYQLQYAAKKSFKKCKTITIRKKSKTKYTIKKLKRGKTYYVRVRTYKNANVNGQQTVVTGAWSKARKVR